MKKFLLSLVMAVSVLSASAVEPKGTPAYYSVSEYVGTIFGPYYYEGLGAVVYEDGNDIYVPIFAASLPEAYMKGSVSADGKTVTFSKNEKVGEFLGYDAYLADYYFEDPDSEEPSAVLDVVLQKDGDHLFINDDIENPAHYFYLMAYDGDSLVGYLTYTMCLDLKKLEVQPELVQVPANATKKEYTYIGYDNYGTPVAQLGAVYFDGSDIYFDHYAGMEAVVKGTVSGNKVSIAKGQFLGVNAYLLHSGAFVTEWEYDDDYNYLGEIKDAFELDYNAETGVFSSTDETFYQCTFADSSLINAISDLLIEPYAGDKPAVPADPSVELYDYTEDYAQYALYGTAYNLDVDGKYINPAKIEVAVVEDGDYLALSPDDYYIAEEMTWIPAGYLDEKDGNDIGFVDGSSYFYLYESLFENIGLQIRYTVGGVTNYSNIVYADVDGEQTIVAVDHATGKPLPDAISSVKNSASAKTYYNLYGLKIEKAQQGLNIINGKMKFVK